MFWEVWRNVAMATNYWGLGGNANKKGGPSSKSTKNSCYDRLLSSSPIISSSDGSGPKKSVSQPVSLTQFTKTDIYSQDDESSPRSSKESISQVAPKDNISSDKQSKSKSVAAGVKRSFSSFFPFSSCTSNGSSSKQYQSSSTDQHIQQIGEIEIDLPDQSQEKRKAVEPINDNIIDYWDDSMELPTCDVCAKAFPTIRQLAAHQRKKRHYGCIECDSIFPSREVLECHREQMCHYEFAVDMYPMNDLNEVDEEADFFESDDDDDNIWDDDQEDCQDEEMERLL